MNVADYSTVLNPQAPPKTASHAAGAVLEVPWARKMSIRISLSSPQAAGLLERICGGPLVAQAELQAAGAFFPEGFVSATAPAQSSLDR